jgi:mannosyltransferase
MGTSLALLAPAKLPRSLRVSRFQLTAVLILVALMLRGLGLTLRPMWLDEGLSAWFSTRSWHYLWTVVPTFETHPPFYYSILKLWCGLFGNSAIALRGLSVLFGIAAVPVTVAAAFEQEKLDPTGNPQLRAAIAGFLVACSPMLVSQGQEARPYPFLVLAYAIAILAILRLMREFTEDGAGRWFSWILLLVGTELTLWAHSLGVLYSICLAMALGPAWLKSPISKTRLWRGCVIAIAVMALYLPCLMMVAGRARDWGANWLTWEPSMLLQLISMYSVVQVTGIISVVAIILMVLLGKRAVRHAVEGSGWNENRAVLLLWFGPPLLSALISAFFVPVFLVRTLTGTLVPAFLAIAGAAARTQSPRERFVLTIAICATLLPSTIEAALRPAFEQWDQAASYLTRNVAPGDQVWLYPSDSAFPLTEAGVKISAPIRYLPAPYPTLGVKGPIRAGTPAIVSLTSDQARTIAADPSLKSVKTVWLVTRQSGIFDPNNDLPNALALVRQRGPVQEWGYISVRPFRSRTQ